jgi:Immunity protein 26
MKFPDTFESGMIFEIPLRNNYGFGYIKMIVASIPFQDSILENQVFLKAFNFYSTSSIEKTFDPKNFNNDDLIFPPQLMAFRPNKKGQDKWTYLGKSSLTPEDEIIPDFRELSNMANPTHYHSIHGYGIQRIFPKYERFFVTDINTIKHLSFWQHFHPIRFCYLLTTHWILKNGDKIVTIFDNNDKNYGMVEDSLKFIRDFKSFQKKEIMQRFRLPE